MLPLFFGPEFFFYGRSFLVLRFLFDGLYVRVCCRPWSSRLIMKRLLVFIVFMLLFNFSFAQVPVYTGRVNNAAGSLIQKKTNKWGFAANDPRYNATVSAVGGAVTTIAVGVVGGAIATVGWPALLVAAGVSAVVSGGVSLAADGLSSWLFNSDGTVTVSQPGSVGGSDKGVPPVAVNGDTAFFAFTYNGLRVEGNSIEGVFKSTLNFNECGSYAACQNNSTLTWNYDTTSVSGSNPTIYTISGFWSASNTTNTWPRVISVKGSSALSGNAAYTVPPLAPVTKKMSVSDAVAAIPQSDLVKPLSDDALAALVNQIWKSMGNNVPNTLPWSATDPVTAADVAQWKAQNPALVPTVGDFVSAVAPPGTSAVVIPNAGLGTNSQPDPSTSPSSSASTSTQTDFGNFTAPILEDTPTVSSILDPIFNMWPQWSNYAFPSHVSECPKPTFVALGHTFTFDQMCSWSELIKPAVQAAFALVWALMVIFIVMGA